MRALVLCLAAVLCGSGPAVAHQTPAFDAQARITEALAAVRPIAMNADQVDWVAIEAQAREMAATANDTIDLLPAYHLIVWSLRDDHSFIDPTNTQVDEWVRRNNRTRYLPDTPRPRGSVSAFKRRQVSGRDLILDGGHMAREIVVPAYSGDGADNAYADAVAAQITANPESCGFVVDLRGNTGGNMGPMQLGLSPLMGEGYSFPTVAGPGMFDAVYRIENGAMMGYETSDAAEGVNFGRLTEWPGKPALASAPAAVLIDQATASSGEATAIALIGRSATRFFGEKTFGVASANQDLVLSDGIRLFVTIGYLKDGAGRTYPDGIPPDEAVATGPGDPNDPDDAVVEAAKAWLNTQGTCAA